MSFDPMSQKLYIQDVTLRDGMHAKREQMSIEQMVKIATALDEAGVPYIQVTHGAGLGGNSLQHGFAPHSNEEYLSAVCRAVKKTKVSVLLLPGLGTMRELQSAYDCGARSVHVATHCTEADTSPQHIAFARKLGMDSTDGTGAVTCAKNSRHMWGAAADMDLKYESAATQASFPFVFHENGGTGAHLHVDMQACK